MRLKSPISEASLLKPPPNLAQPRQAQLKYPSFMYEIMEKGLETGARGAESGLSSTTSQLYDFGQIAAFLSLNFLRYKIGLIIKPNIHYSKYFMYLTSFNNT